MRKHRHITAANSVHPLCISRDEWIAVVKSLGLSPRETEIIKLVFCGKTDKQIAIDLGMSKNTVRTHLRHIFLRRGLGGRMELAMYIFALIREPHHQNG